MVFIGPAAGVQNFGCADPVRLLIWQPGKSARINYRRVELKSRASLDYRKYSPALNFYAYESHALSFEISLNGVSERKAHVAKN